MHHHRPLSRKPQALQPLRACSPAIPTDDTALQFLCRVLDIGEFESGIQLHWILPVSATNPT